ncbi:MAG: DUF4301 family protein [Paludibacteraceae bacterium]|nr:DUF4301 family protein [Paludibacteraceae bacterium]
MLTKEDSECLAQKGISVEKLEEQLKRFRDGFPFLKVYRPAVLGDGIIHIEESDKSFYIDKWASYLNGKVNIVKFVPASGAASRMFKTLFEFLDLDNGVLFRESDLKFFDDIEKFAFFESLNDKCIEREGKGVLDLKKEGRYKAIVTNLLDSKGLNYGMLPKGLLLFHKYQNSFRTPFEEHLVEGALYAKNGEGVVNLHFTVSPEHLKLFQSICSLKLEEHSFAYGTKFNVDFSVQKSSTDTVAVDKDNHLFKINGSLVFRPGGHGALIENLNEIEADVIFIKNIDNVVPDSYKQPTIEYKTLLAGMLVVIQQQIFDYQRLLEETDPSVELINEMLDFCKTKLYVFSDEVDSYSKERKIAYLKRMFNRPIRVCGMVKNEGEPGGGPFLCMNQDGTRSLQILESSQFDKDDEEQHLILKKSAYFNPVDLVCAVKNYKGEKYDLRKFVDQNTGFISLKSKDGKELKALELPGLWNGAMSDWNTVFVEVPIETFNPVKVVNDLLRKEHQGR